MIERAQAIRNNAGWGFLAIVGIILIIAGFYGRPGSLLAVVVAPDQLLTPDTQGSQTADTEPAIGPDNG